jgi:hypothetical protein
MYLRADDLKRVLDDVQPSWESVAAALPDIDEARDGSGKRPNGERVRKTWFEVRQAKGWETPKAATASRRSRAVEPLIAVATIASDQPVATLFDQDDADREPAPRFTFRPTKLR